jgi:hypothetical protein
MKDGGIPKSEYLYNPNGQGNIEDSEVYKKLKNLNSMAVVRKRTIPTERPPLVGEVSAKLYG